MQQRSSLSPVMAFDAHGLFPSSSATPGDPIATNHSRVDYNIEQLKSGGLDDSGRLRTRSRSRSRSTSGESSSWVVPGDMSSRAMAVMSSLADGSEEDALVEDAMAALPVVMGPSHWPGEPLASRTAQYSPNGVNELVQSPSIKTEDVEMTLSPGEESHADETTGGRTVSALELKRLRNRECMRRSRHRKQEELNAMKKTIHDLEEKLRSMQLQKTQALQTLPDNSDSVQSTVQRLVVELQEENFSLRDEIRERDKLREIIGPLLEQEEQRKTLDEQQRLHEELHNDQFAWLRHVTPILALKSMTPAQVAALVRESCDQILSIARRADASVENPNRVFGWSDKRVVNDQYVHFMFSKDFAHQDIEEVTTKSWETSSDLSKIDAFQPRAQRMVVLHRWNDDTVVIARNLHVPQLSSDGSELERNYCSVFLVFRLKTPSGFVVGTRTLEPERIHEALRLAGDYRVTYVSLTYGLLFTPLADSKTGCNVRFGGRAGNGTRIYAQVCAMDVMLAILRWENHCIAPLNRLAPSPAAAETS